MNLGFASMQFGRYDEAVDWLRSAHLVAVELGSDFWTHRVVGNLGWAYFQLEMTKGRWSSFSKRRKAPQD